MMLWINVSTNWVRKLSVFAQFFFSNHSIQMVILSRKVNKHVFIWMYGNYLIVSSARNKQNGC